MSKLFRKIRARFFLPPSYVTLDTSNSEQKQNTLVLLHGIGADSATFKPLINILSDENYRIIALDLLGHGKSPQPNIEYNVNNYARSIRKTLRSLRVRGRIILVGHSMGAIIAAHYGRKYRRQVCAEFLVSMPLYPRNVDFHTLLSRRQTDVYIKAYELLLANKEFTIRVSRKLRELLQITSGIKVTQMNWNVFESSLRRTIMEQNTYEDIKKTRAIPISVIYGSVDEFLVSRNIKKLGKLLNVKVKQVIAANHIFSFRLAREIRRQLAEFS